MIYEILQNLSLKVISDFRKLLIRDFKIDFSQGERDFTECRTPWIKAISNGKCRSQNKCGQLNLNKYKHMPDYG